VIAELASGARATFTVSRVARGANEQTVECYGSQGGLTYKLDRVGSRWYRGELQATEGSAALAPVSISAGLPKSTGEGDQLEVTGKATIGPLVKRFLTAIKKGEPTSPSLEDGLRAQEVLDAVLAQPPHHAAGEGRFSGTRAVQLREISLGGLGTLENSH
jgi:predicted dehydrogenase